MNFFGFYRTLWCLGICIAATGTVSADTIFLKNGQRVEGKVVYQGPGLVRIRTNDGLQAVQRDRIRRLTYGPWQPGRRAEPPRRVRPVPEFNPRNERRQWWNFWRGSEGLAPGLPRPQERPAYTPPVQPDPEPPRQRFVDPEPQPTAPILKEPLKEIFKPRERDPVTNEIQDLFYFRIGIANGDYFPFLDRALNRYEEFSFLYGELFRRDKRAREYEARSPWGNPNFSMFPVSFRIFLPRSYIAGEYYRSKNSPKFRSASLIFEQGGSQILTENTSFEKVRVDRLFRFRGALRGGFHLLDREDLKLSLYGGGVSMRLYAKQDSQSVNKSFTQESSGVPVLFDFTQSLDRVSNTEMQGPTAGAELEYTAPFNMEFWLRAGSYQLSGNYYSLIREQAITASSNLFKTTHNQAFLEDRHESQIAVSGVEALLGFRFPAGATRSLFVEFAGESFQTTHTKAVSYAYGVARIAEGKYKPVYQDRDEVVELILFSDILGGYLNASDSFWYGTLGMEFRF